jgi:lipopolysaccharide export system protein LptA
VIRAEDQVFWSANDNVAIFEKNVIVNRPDLRIWCDVLEVSLIPPAEEAEGTTPPDPGKSDSPKPESSSTMNEDSLKQAIAKSKGGVVVIRRRTEKGEVVATCQEAVYDGPTGNIVLKQRPELIQDLKLHVIGTDVITLFRDGNIRASKRPEMQLIQPSAGRDIRRKLLSNIPPRQGAADTESSDSTNAADAPLAAPPSAPTPPVTTPPGARPPGGALPPAPTTPASPLKPNR